MKVKLILLSVVLLVVAAYVINHYRRANARAKADQFSCDGNSVTIHGQVFTWDDSNEYTSPWYFPRIEWPSSCELSSDPNLGVCLQALDDIAEISELKDQQ